MRRKSSQEYDLACRIPFFPSLSVSGPSRRGFVAGHMDVNEQLLILLLFLKLLPLQS